MERGIFEIADRASIGAAPAADSVTAHRFGAILLFGVLLGCGCGGGGGGMKSPTTTKVEVVIASSTAVVFPGDTIIVNATNCFACKWSATGGTVVGDQAEQAIFTAGTPGSASVTATSTGGSSVGTSATTPLFTIVTPYNSASLVSTTPASGGTGSLAVGVKATVQYTSTFPGANLSVAVCDANKQVVAPQEATPAIATSHGTVTLHSYFSQQDLKSIPSKVTVGYILFDMHLGKEGWSTYFPVNIELSK